MSDPKVRELQHKISLAMRDVRRAKYDLAVYGMPHVSKALVEELNKIIDKMEAEASNISDQAISLFAVNGDGDEWAHKLMSDQSEIRADADVLRATIAHLIDLTNTLEGPPDE